MPQVVADALDSEGLAVFGARERGTEHVGAVLLQQPVELLDLTEPGARAPVRALRSPSTISGKGPARIFGTPRAP